MKQKIFANDFIDFYPEGLMPCQMYVNVANEIYDEMQGLTLDLPDSNKIKKDIAINVAIYFEDKMSRIGLWNAFVAMHQRTYHLPLPFFDKHVKLFNDEVNEPEIELLVWIVISRRFNNRFLNPIAIGENTAKIIMDVLDAYNEVEVNEALYNFIYNKEIANDYFRLKHTLLWLRRSYLLCSPLTDERFKEFYSSTLQYISDKNKAHYYAETLLSMTTEIGPMAEKPHFWLAEMYKGNGMKGEADKLMNLMYCHQDSFEVVSANSLHVILRDSKGDEFKVKNQYPMLLCKCNYIGTALVKYDDCDWEINGVLHDTVKKVYEKMQERQDQLKISYEKTFPLFMERTNGKRLAFFEKTIQIKDWMQKITPELDTSSLYSRLSPGSQVAFISKKAGIIFAPEIIHAVKHKDNPLYKKCGAATMQVETMNAVLNYEATHPELLQYLLENKMLQDGDISSMNPTKEGNKIFTNNIDFIARNHRRHYYHDHDY
ncbi:MAG: DUF3843 family protein [Paludibacteraceae bacterium]|nr:DUF3843 family protein [Paludibacteraceae bacterium]